MYEEQRKKKMARKKQSSQVVKEMKFHANTAEHDYQTKMGHIKDFLDKGFKIKLILTFRGRENAHKELGVALMNRVIKDTEGLCTIDQMPRVLGRIIIAMISGKAKS